MREPSKAISKERRAGEPRGEGHPIADGLPTFEAKGWSEHVEAWREVHDQLEDRLWMLGAIAASLTRTYGDRAIPEFASEVGYSARRVWELAATYKAWENRDRAHDLSFKHHTVAARAEDPDAAIEEAIAGSKENPERPGPMPVRELERTLRGEPGEANVETVHLVACPKCGEEYEMSEALTREIAR